MKKKIIIIIMICLSLVACGEAPAQSNNSQQEQINLLMQEADTAYQQKQYQIAQAKYSDVLGLAPAYEDALLNRARTYIAQDAVKEAKADLQQVSKNMTHRSAMYDEVEGSIAWKEREFEKALQAYMSAIQKTETSERLMSRGHIYYQLHKNTEAKTDLQKVLRTDVAKEHKMKIHYTLAEIAVYENNYNESLKQLETLLTLDGNNTKAKAMQAYVWLKLQPKDTPKSESDALATKAKAQSSAAVQSTPQDAVVHNYHGLVLYVLGADTEALASFTQAIAIDDKEASFYNNKALCLYRLGENEKAHADVTLAINLDKKEPEYYLGRGYIELMMEQESSAMGDFQQAYSLDATYKARIPEQYQAQLVDKTKTNQ